MESTHSFTHPARSPSFSLTYDYLTPLNNNVISTWHTLKFTPFRVVECSDVYYNIETLFSKIATSRRLKVCSIDCPYQVIYFLLLLLVLLLFLFLCNSLFPNFLLPRNPSEFFKAVICSCLFPSCKQCYRKTTCAKCIHKWTNFYRTIMASLKLQLSKSLKNLILTLNDM